MLACGGTNGKPSARFLSIATGGTGGVYYPYGGGIAKVLNEKLPAVRATAEVTAASVDNLKLIRDGKADIAFALADTLADAVEGRGAVRRTPVPAAAWRCSTPTTRTWSTLASSNRSGPSPICAARWSRLDRRAAEPSSSRSAVSRPPDSIRIATAAPGARRRRSPPTRLKDGKIDAFFWSGGLPTAAIQDLAHTPGSHDPAGAERRRAAPLQRDLRRCSTFR